MQKRSPCKVNLLLNILGKRPDGFHELETIMYPLPFCDTLDIERTDGATAFSCKGAELPADSSNLVIRAWELFRERAKVKGGVRIHLEKRIPIGGGLGGGSANAAITLLALNEIFGNPLRMDDLHTLAAQLGSDVPFFLQPRPALATGRGEVVRPLDWFPALQGKWFLLVYPGFGVPTAWAYKHLQPPYGEQGRAVKLLKALGDFSLQPSAFSLFYNSLEKPVLRKYPLLELIQEFLRDNGALAAVMSGSGSTTFAICSDEAQARALESKTQAKFGPLWTAAVPAQT